MQGGTGGVMHARQALRPSLALGQLPCEEALDAGEAA